MGPERLHRSEMGTFFFYPCRGLSSSWLGRIPWPVSQGLCFFCTPDLQWLLSLFRSSSFSCILLWVSLYFSVCLSQKSCPSKHDDLWWLMISCNWVTYAEILIFWMYPYLHISTDLNCNRFAYSECMRCQDLWRTSFVQKVSKSQKK